MMPYISCLGSRIVRARAKRWIQIPACDILKAADKTEIFFEETGAGNHAQTHISTQPPPPCENTRVSGAHEDQGRRSRAQPPPRRRPQARVRQRRAPRLSPSGRSCLQRNVLRWCGRSGSSLPHELSFQARPSANRWRVCACANMPTICRAYANGRKRQSATMSWFLAPQTPGGAAAGAPAAPRVGLTVGKVLGQAHQRNRIKRRMREALRRHIDLAARGLRSYLPSAPQRAHHGICAT